MVVIANPAHEELFEQEVFISLLTFPVSKLASLLIQSQIFEYNCPFSLQLNKHYTSKKSMNLTVERLHNIATCKVHQNFKRKWLQLWNGLPTDFH